MRKKLFLPAVLLTLFFGCSKLETKIDTPSYIQIDDYTVITDSSSQGQGTSNQKFSDVLVTSATKNYGYYPIPGKIPIPLEGMAYLSIRAAVKVNGVNYLRLDYPVMKGCDSTLPLKRGEVLHVKPVFKYFSTDVFPLIEDFEETINFKMKDSDPLDTFCIKTDTANAYFGKTCLRIRLDGVHTIAQLQSCNGFSLPNNGANTYVEFNYKSNTSFEVGVIGALNAGQMGTDQRSAGGANPSAAWNKMYIDLTNLVRTPPTYPDYFLYFYTTTGFNANGVANPEIYLDNIKVVHQ